MNTVRSAAFTGLCMLATAPVAGQQYVTKHLSDFATPGGGGFPNDSINDHQAFRDAAAFFQANNGNGTLILGDGEYIMGAQQFRSLSDPLPGPDWNNHGYPGEVALQCKSLVAWQEGFKLDSCFNFTIQGGTNTSVRYRDCLYYGTFLRHALTGVVTSAVAPQDTVLGTVVVSRCVTCVDTLILPQHLNIPLLHAEVGTMFTFKHCDGVTVRDVDLHGNIDAANLGGKVHPDGMQTAHDGIILWESSRCLIENVQAHHFGRDGITIMSTDTNRVTPYTQLYPGLVVDVDTNGTVVFNNTLRNSRFEWNGRQGLSWTGCSGLVAENCHFNHNGAGRMSSLPGSGLDIEGGGGPMRVRYGAFDDCRFLHNWDAGVLSDASPCYGQQDFRFTNCVMKAGEKGIAVMPSTRGMKFEGCSIYGRVEDLFEQAENLTKNPDFDLLFLNTDFYEEDGQWSYLGWHPDSVWNNHCESGPHKLDLVGMDRRANVHFENCDFYTNCRGMIRFLGRPTGAFDLQFPYCPTCDSCGYQNNTCPPTTCNTLGPCYGSDCVQQDARYMRVKNCSLTSTGRMRCTSQTQVLAVDLTTVEGFILDIPLTVRGGGDGDTYAFPFGTTTWAPSCFPDYCPAPTVHYTDNGGVFPPCLPFYSDSVPAWSYCNPAGNLPAPPCGNYTLTKTATPTETQPDSTVTFTIAVCNNTVFATPVVLSDPLPPSFTVTGASIWSGVDTTLWSTADTTLTLNNGQCAEFVITGYFTAFGEFTNTVALDTDTATAGAELSASATVSVVSACAAEHIIPDGALASVVGSVYSGTTVTIMGQFIVDDDVLFENCQVYMEAGAEIVVLPGRTLDIMSSSVTSCQQVMWKGITAQDGSLVRMRSSFVDDAENVITALDGSTLWLRSNQFHNNRTTISIPAVSGVPYNNVALYLRQNTFYSQDLMPQPYPGQATAVGMVGFAALDVHNTTLHLTDGENVIHTLSNGIVARRSSLEVIGWSMHGIQPDAAYAYAGNGAGIYAHGNNASCTLKQQGYGQGGTDPPSFVDCHWGIYAEYMNVKSASNRMLGMGTAHRVDFGGFRRVQLLNNTMQALRHGIDLRFNDGAQEVLVQHNDITFGALGCSSNCPGYSGINVAEGNYPSESSVIRNNVIRFVAGRPSRIGINLLSAAEWLVAGNEVIIAHNTHNITGVLLNGCNRTEVSCNTISSTFNDWSNDRQAAISNFMGSAPLISCNDMDRTTNGILFNGVAPDADVRGNRIRRHKWGLHLMQTAIIGLQELKGNLWHNAPPLDGWGAWNQHPEALNDPFRYNPALINGGSTQPPSSSPDGWFSFLFGLNYDCANHGEVDYCSQFVKRGKEQLTDLDVRVALDSLENDPYTEESKWMLKSGLYKKLDENPELRDSLQLMADLHAALQGSARASFKSIDDGQSALFILDSTMAAQLEANHLLIDSLGALIQDALSHLGDSTLSMAQAHAIISNISAYKQSIADLSAWITAELQSKAEEKAIGAGAARAANAAVQASELIEDNLKQVNELYLATIAVDTGGFTPTQAGALLAIAAQCPMIGGNAVFKARALYGLIDPAQEYDDALLCQPFGIDVKRFAGADQNEIVVVPNPAGEEAALVLSRALNEPGRLLVYNALGAEVLRVVIPAEAKRVTFPTSCLAPGLYHYKMVVQTGVLGNGKLTIVR